MIDKLNIGQKFIITYRPMTHNGEARPKLKDGKTTRQITRRAQWNDKCRIKGIKIIIFNILLIMTWISRVIVARLVKFG